MAHVPHLLVDGPWLHDHIEVTPEQRRHLTAVLRRDPGSPISYTDGQGNMGEGTWNGVGVRRGTETLTPGPQASLTLAVAPPDSKDRVRWLVEKSTELGVERIRWLRTAYGQGRVPRLDRAQAWMKRALEQSRRSRLTVIDAGWTELGDLGDFVAADRTGARFWPEGSITVAIGPEGGWAPAELPPAIPLISLGVSVLRTETAAIGAAAVFSANFSGEPNQ